MSNVQLKDWLSQQLKSKGLSAYEFYQRAKISKAAMYFYLRGQRLPDESAVARIAAALEVPLDQVPPINRPLPGKAKPVN